jgi:hypothetical protein
MQQCWGRQHVPIDERTIATAKIFDVMMTILGIENSVTTTHRCHIQRKIAITTTANELTVTRQFKPGAELPASYEYKKCHWHYPLKPNRLNQVNERKKHHPGLQPLR